MAKQINDQLDQWISSIKRSAEKALLSVGEDAVRRLVTQEADSDTTGRLRDSFTFATSSSPAKPGTQALASDAVDTPTEPFQLVFGTKCPYAEGVNYGLEPGQVESYDILLPKITKWLQDKGVTSSLGWSLDQLAKRISYNLVMEGSMAHEFWEPALAEIRATAGKIIQAELNRSIPVKGIKLKTDIKL
jgi:hypothetical protein